MDSVGRHKSISTTDIASVAEAAGTGHVTTIDRVSPTSFPLHIRGVCSITHDQWLTSPLIRILLVAPKHKAGSRIHGRHSALANVPSMEQFFLVAPDGGSTNNLRRPGW